MQITQSKMFCNNCRWQCLDVDSLRCVYGSQQCATSLNVHENLMHTRANFRNSHPLLPGKCFNRQSLW